VRRGYLRFNVQGVGPVSSAVLKFYAETGSSTGIEVHAVTDTTWGETTTTYNNAPAVGAVLDTTGPFSSGTWITVDVSSAVTGDGLVSFALTTPSNSSIRVTSREGTNKPQLIAPAPAGPSPYLVSRIGATTYQAVSQTTGTTFTGTAKFVVESAVADLEAFDRGNDVVVERVKITASRGRGIVFDGKNDSWTSLRNTVRDCVINGTSGDGIELLASSNNTIQGCTITNTGGHGIQVNKSSTTADQANKKSNDNQTPKTQKYGLNIASSLCNRTVVGPSNNFAGNLTAPIHDIGTGTIYQ